VYAKIFLPSTAGTNRTWWIATLKSPTGCRCQNRRRRTNAEKNNFNHPDSGNSGSGDVVQLQLFPAGYHPVNDKFTAAGVAASIDLGVGMMVFAGAMAALVLLTFLMVCCILSGGGEE
jgi:hypothetical protein